MISAEYVKGLELRIKELTAEVEQHKITVEYKTRHLQQCESALELAEKRADELTFKLQTQCTRMGEVLAQNTNLQEDLKALSARDLEQQIKALESILEIPLSSCGPVKVEIVSHSSIKGRIQQLRQQQKEG